MTYPLLYLVLAQGFAPPEQPSWRQMAMLLAGAAITSFGAAGLRYGVQRIGREVPSAAMPLVTLGVGFGVSYLNGYLQTKGLPALPMPTEAQLDPAITGAVVAGLGTIGWKTNKELGKRADEKRSSAPPTVSE